MRGRSLEFGAPDIVSLEVCPCLCLLGPGGLHRGMSWGTDPWYIAGSISLGPSLPPAEPQKMPQPLPYVGPEQNSGSPAEAQGRVVPIR